jgi:hypothetical protein
MSPEQLLGEDLDARSDVFALGVLTWVSIVGRRVFKLDGDYASCKAITEESIPRATLVRDDVPAALADAIAKALARDRNERFDNARDFALALENALQGLAGPLSPLAIAAELERAFASTLTQQRELVLTAQKLADATDDEDADEDADASASGETAAQAVARPSQHDGPEPPAQDTVISPNPFFDVPAPDTRPAVQDLGVAVTASSALSTPLSDQERSAAALAVYPPHSAHSPYTTITRDSQVSLVAAQVDWERGPETTRRGWVIGLVAVMAIAFGLGVLGPSNNSGETEVATSEKAVATEPAAKIVHTATASPRPERTSPPPPGIAHTAQLAQTTTVTAAPLRRPAGNGLLVLDSTPWAFVSIDGRDVGQTPIIGHTLTAGWHQVKLVSSTPGQPDKYLSLKIGSGKVVRKKVVW